MTFWWGVLFGIVLTFVVSLIFAVWLVSTEVWKGRR